MKPAPQAKTPRSLEKLSRLILGTKEPESLTTLVFMTLLGLVLVMTTASRQVLSILPLAIEGDGPGYLNYARSLGGGGIEALSPHWQPGYPFLIMIAHELGLDPFRVGTWISCLAGLLLLPLSYRVAQTLFDQRVARWSMLLVGSSGLLVLNSCSVNSDMLHALLFTAAVLPLLGEDGGSLRRIAISGLIVGVAFMVRHQALALVLLPVLRGLSVPRGKRLTSSMVGLACFFVAASPVLIAYGIQFGDPFHNDLYTNVAAAAFYDGDMNLFFHEGHHRQYSSWIQVINQGPWEVFLSLAGNIVDATGRLVTSLHLLPLGVLGGAGIFLLAGRRHGWGLLALAVCVASSTPSKVEDRYLIAALPLVMPFAAALGLDIVDKRISGRLSEGIREPLSFWGPTLLFVGLLFCGVTAGADALRSEDPIFRDAGLTLKDSTPTPYHGLFLSQNAFHIGYYAQMEGVALGPSHVGDPAHGRRATHAALAQRLGGQGIPYFVYHEQVGQAHPELVHLADPRNAPPFLEVLHAQCGSRIVVYAVRLDEMGPNQDLVSP